MTLVHIVFRNDPYMQFWAQPCTCIGMWSVLWQSRRLVEGSVTSGHHVTWNVRLQAKPDSLG